MHGPVDSCIFYETFHCSFYRLSCQKAKDTDFFSVFFIFDMPRILQNLRERAIGILHAGMTTNDDAKNIGCSTSAIRQLMQRFQVLGRTED
jgi:hypothetical protein